MKFRATVREIMNTKVHKVDVDDSIKTAAEVMSAHRSGSVLVMGQKHLKGILTAEDIVQKHVALGKGRKVSEIMTKDPHTISPDRTIEDAAKIMSEKKIKKLPVVERGIIVGVITASDIIRVEPELYEILLERLRIERPEMARLRAKTHADQCESCGNYTEYLVEKDGQWLCRKCRE